MDATAACCLLVLFSELGIIMMASLHVCRGSVHGALPGNDTTAIQAAEPLPAAILVEGINHLIEAGPAGDYYRSALFTSVIVDCHLQRLAQLQHCTKKAACVVQMSALPSASAQRGEYC